jgi:transposase
LADNRGRPVAFALTPGNVADITMAVPLISAVAPPRRLIADKAYGSESLRSWLKLRRIRAVIPSTASRAVPYPLDRSAYRRRNLIDRLFCRLKNPRTHRHPLRPAHAKLQRGARPRGRRPEFRT